MTKLTRRHDDGGPGSTGPRPDPTRITITEAVDFIAVVPYLLGFHPRQSVVVLFFERGRVRLTARLDLPGTPGAPATVELMAAEIAKLARHTGSTSVVLLCYVDTERRRPELRRLARDSRLCVTEALQVGTDRWWALGCPDHDGDERGGEYGRAGREDEVSRGVEVSCCPAAGTPYDLRSHPLVAEAVLAGLAAEPDREAVMTWVCGPPSSDLARLDAVAAAALLALPRSRERRKQRMRRLVTRALQRPASLTDRECADLAVLCIELDVRDVAWALMTRVDAEAHLVLWRRVVSRTVDYLSPGPLGLLSVAAWISGNGALLNCGAERLETLRPDYGLLSVLRDLSSRAVPPSTWDEIAPAMRAELDLVVPVGSIG